MSALQTGETAFCSPVLTTSSGMTLIIPVKLHPEVIVQAAPSRDRNRAE